MSLFILNHVCVLGSFRKEKHVNELCVCNILTWITLNNVYNVLHVQHKVTQHWRIYMGNNKVRLGYVTHKTYLSQPTIDSYGCWSGKLNYVVLTVGMQSTTDKNVLFR